MYYFVVIYLCRLHEYVNYLESERKRICIHMGKKKEENKIERGGCNQFFNFLCSIIVFGYRAIIIAS